MTKHVPKKSILDSHQHPTIAHLLHGILFRWEREEVTAVVLSEFDSFPTTHALIEVIDYLTEARTISHSLGSVRLMDLDEDFLFDTLLEQILISPRGNVHTNQHSLITVALDKYSNACEALYTFTLYHAVQKQIQIISNSLESPWIPSYACYNVLSKLPMKTSFCKIHTAIFAVLATLEPIPSHSLDTPKIVSLVAGYLDLFSRENMALVAYEEQPTTLLEEIILGQMFCFGNTLYTAPWNLDVLDQEELEHTSIDDSSLCDCAIEAATNMSGDCGAMFKTFATKSREECPD